MAEQPDGHPCDNPEPHGPHTWHPHGDPLDVEHCPGVLDPHQCAYDLRGVGPTTNTHYAVTIDASNNMTLIACGPREYCEQYLANWLERHPLGEFDAAELLSREDECGQLLDRQSQLLTGVVNALKGEPPELTHWSHHDAPELAAAMRERAERAEEERDMACLNLKAQREILQAQEAAIMEALDIMLQDSSATIEQANANYDAAVTRAERAEAELERLRAELRRLIEHRNPVAPAAIEEALEDG